MTRILVVDDMAVFREPIAAALRSHGLEVQCAADGLQAVAMLQEKPVNLVLLDMAMPGLDGLGVLRIMKKDAKLAGIPVILLTAVAERDYVRQAASLGVRDYLLKSHFSLAHLLERIKHCLASQGAVSTSEIAKNAVPIPPSTPPNTPSDTPLPPHIPPTHTPHIEGFKTVNFAPPTPPATPATPPVTIATTTRAPAPIDPQAALKDLKPIHSRTAIAQLLERCGELKALSPTVSQLLQITQNPDCAIERVTGLIKQDHAIALKILKLANSVVYTRGDPVESVQKAVMRIGLQQIRQVVLNIGLIERFSNAAVDARINSAMFWEHSIATGLIAAEISRSLNLPPDQIDAAFTMGLLHDVGRVVYAELLDDRYVEILNQAAQLQMPLEQVETRMLLVNHADAMDRLLRDWHFPKNLIDPIALHHLSLGNIRRISPTTVTAVSILATANRLAHALLLGCSGNATLYPIEEFVLGLKLPEELMTRIETQIPSQTDDIKFAMLACSNQAAWPQFHLAMRSNITQPIHPLHISMTPEYNVFRMSTDRLLTEAPDQRPNLAVVHITDIRQRLELSEELARLEAQLAVSNLPVLMLSPGGKLQLPPTALQGRDALALPSILTVERYLAAMQSLLTPRQALAA